MIAGEILGGIALILGAFTPSGMALLPILLGATWMHLGNNWVFSAEGGGWEFPSYWSRWRLLLDWVVPGSMQSIILSG